MGKTKSLRNNFGIWDFNERHNKHVCVPDIEGSYLMIYAYKTQDIASCKTLDQYILNLLNSPRQWQILSGCLGVCTNPPLGKNYFIFMENFQRNLENIHVIINQVK